MEGHRDTNNGFVRQAGFSIQPIRSIHATRN
jgi:hypothetical protein